MTKVVFTRIYISEAENPETGEMVRGVRVRTADARVFKVREDIEDIKAYGSKEKVLNSLILRDGMFGTYATLPQHKDLGDIEWDDDAKDGDAKK